MRSSWSFLFKHVFFICQSVLWLVSESVLSYIWAWISNWFLNWFLVSARDTVLMNPQKNKTTTCGRWLFPSLYLQIAFHVVHHPSTHNWLLQSRIRSMKHALKRCQNVLLIAHVYGGPAVPPIIIFLFVVLIIFLIIFSNFYLYCFYVQIDFMTKSNCVWMK